MLAWGCDGSTVSALKRPFKIGERQLIRLVGEIADLVFRRMKEGRGRARHRARADAGRRPSNCRAARGLVNGRDRR